MDNIGYYKVTVKVGVEQDNGKIKYHKENYLVHDAGSPQIAANVVEKEFSGCMDEWQIECVKQEKIDAILDALEDER